MGCILLIGARLSFDGFLTRAIVHTAPFLCADTPGFASANDYPDNKDEREHHPMTADAGGEGGEGTDPWGR